mmetsp:Transcript_12881/g.14893  ORF Transcript_12881/g.14893 Transcript_12881/m.14893 type:complete len:301 (-) Transcript_12881:155-1057(-)
MATKSLKKSMQGFRALSWWTPFTVLPHGITGLIGIITGAYIVQGALLGPGKFSYSLSSNYKKEPAWMDYTVLWIYVVCAFNNGLAGYLLANKAPGRVRDVFKFTALLQMCLVYFIYRFMGFTEIPLLHVVDIVAAIGILITIGIMFYNVTLPRKGQPNITLPVGIGCFALALLAGYPLQLAFGGKEWYECVLDTYPMQQVGFVYYVYVPATFTFAAMLFGATLLMRKIISEAFFGVVFVSLILFTLFSTVLLQEIHIPFVSTQKLVINCPADNTSLIFALSELLDTSTLARSFLHFIGAI